MRSHPSVHLSILNKKGIDSIGSLSIWFGLGSHCTLLLTNSGIGVCTAEFSLHTVIRNGAWKTWRQCSINYKAVILIFFLLGPKILDLYLSSLTALSFGSVSTSWAILQACIYRIMLPATQNVWHFWFSSCSWVNLSTQSVPSTIQLLAPCSFKFEFSLPLHYMSKLGENSEL